MKLLYIGTHFCPPDVLARLLVLGDELVFLDRPSVTFDNWGTVGSASPMRRFSWEGSPVKVSVVEPPSGPARNLFEAYVLADINNPAFVRAFLDGLKSDYVFAERFLPPGANYGEGRSGADIRRLLVADPSLYEAQMDLTVVNPTVTFRPDTAEVRRTFAQPDR